MWMNEGDRLILSLLAWCLYVFVGVNLLARREVLPLFCRRDAVLYIVVYIIGWPLWATVSKIRNWKK